MHVNVKDNNVESAMKNLKRKMQQEGIFKKLKQTTAYEKPSEKKLRKRTEAIKKIKKLERKKLERFGY